MFKFYMKIRGIDKELLSRIILSDILDEEERYIAEYVLDHKNGQQWVNDDGSKMTHLEAMEQYYKMEEAYGMGCL